MEKNKGKTKYITAILVVFLLIVGLNFFPDNFKHQIYNQSTIYKSQAYHALNNLVNKSIPTKYIDQTRLEQKLAKPADWMLKQIELDFAPYNDFSKKNVIRTFETLPEYNYLVLFKIKDGKVSVQKATTMNGACQNGVEIYTNAVKYIAEKGYVKDVVFLLKLSDYFEKYQDFELLSYAPILATSRDNRGKLDKNLVLIPDYMSLEDIPAFKQEIEAANNKYQWDNKINKVIWRGGRADVSGMRQQVVETSKSNQNSIIDADFITQKRKFMSLTDQIAHKYLLSIDGHTAAWTRPVWQLMSNSVMVKQRSDLVQWYYAAIQSDLHYISVDSVQEIENIPQKYSDVKLQQIAQNGKDFANENLAIEDMVAYMVLVLQRYEVMQNLSNH